MTTFSVEEELKRQPLINADLYEKASNWGQKSDILRMELLLRYGGVRPSAPAPTSPLASSYTSSISATVRGVHGYWWKRSKCDKLADCNGDERDALRVGQQLVLG